MGREQGEEEQETQENKSSFKGEWVIQSWGNKYMLWVDMVEHCFLKKEFFFLIQRKL